MQKQELPRFLFFLKLCWENRKFLIIFNSVVLVLSVIIALIQPVWYKADSTILIQVDDSKALAVSGLLQGLPIPIGGTPYEAKVALIKALFKSRSFMESIIEKFDLHRVYESQYKQDTYLTLQENLYLVDNEDGTFTVYGLYEESPELAAEMVNFAVQKLIELSIEIDRKKATNYRQYLEKSYQRIEEELFKVEDSLKHFQQESGIIQLEDQVRALIEQVSALEAQKIQTEIELDFYRSNFNENYQKIEALQKQIAIINTKINALKTTKEYSNLALNLIPQEGLSYLRLYREVMIRNKVIEFLLPQLEKAKLDEIKNISNLVILDRAVPPERKAKPRRSLIVLASLFFAGLLSLIIVYLRAYYQDHKDVLKQIF